MLRNNFTEQDLIDKGYVQGERGVWEKAPEPISDEKLKKLSDIATHIAEKNNTVEFQEKWSQSFLDLLVFGETEIKIPNEHELDFGGVTSEIMEQFWSLIQRTCKKYEFNIIPNTKPRQTISDKWNKRKCVMQYRAFADTLRSQAAMLNFKLKSPLIVEFHVPMALSWGKKKRAEMEGKPHEQTPDVDNFCKAAMDALLGQDNLISEIHARKLWSTNGRIIIYQ